MFFISNCVILNTILGFKYSGSNQILFLRKLLIDCEVENNSLIQSKTIERKVNHKQNGNKSIENSFLTQMSAAS